MSSEEEITRIIATLPSATLETEQTYERGTVLTLQVQVRVRSAYTDEDRKGNTIFKHTLALEEVTVTDALTPSQRKQLIEQAEAEAERAARAAAEYTVPEEDDVITFAHGTEPVADYEYVPEIPEPVVAADDDADDDPEHSWMDEEESESLHVDLSALV